MNAMRKKVFVMLVFLLLLIPGLNTNINTNQVSTMDNRMLSEFPEAVDAGFITKMENYLKDRVGFRTQLITFYQESTNIFFHVLAHPSYMYGNDGQIYTGWDLINYQHMETGDYPEVFGEYMKSMQVATESTGAFFYFMMPPSKETIYYEDYPKGYNVDDNPSRTELIRDSLNSKEVRYIDLNNVFMKNRDRVKLYNKEYDAGHYNADGMRLACKSLYERIKADNPEMMSDWKECYYSREMINQKYLQNSYFVINELVPHFATRLECCDDDSELFKSLDTLPFCNRYINKNNIGGLKLMVFGDSFSDVDGGIENYLWPYFSEITRVHNNNTDHYLFYLTSFQPDIVVYEAAERTMQKGIFEVNHLKEEKFYTFDCGQDLSDWVKVSDDSIDVLNRTITGINGKEYKLMMISNANQPKIMAMNQNGKSYIAKKIDDGSFLFFVSADDFKGSDEEYYQINN